MSKTRGNTLDPPGPHRAVRHRRPALRPDHRHRPPANDMRITTGKLENARNFANKVWNAGPLRDDRAARAGRSCGLARSCLRRTPGGPLDCRKAAPGNCRGPDPPCRLLSWGEAQQKLLRVRLGRLLRLVHRDGQDPPPVGGWPVSAAHPGPRPGANAAAAASVHALHHRGKSGRTSYRGCLPRGNLPASIMVGSLPAVRAVTAGPAGRGRGLPGDAGHPRGAEHPGAAPHSRQPAAGGGWWRPTAGGTRWKKRLESYAPCPGWNRSASFSADSGEAEASRGVTLVVNPLVVRLALEGVVDLSAEQQRLQEELDSTRKNLQRVEQTGIQPQFQGQGPARCRGKPKRSVSSRSLNRRGGWSKYWRTWRHSLGPQPGRRPGNPGRTD